MDIILEGFQIYQSSNVTSIGWNFDDICLASVTWNWCYWRWNLLLKSRIFCLLISFRHLSFRLPPLSQVEKTAIISDLLKTQSPQSYMRNIARSGYKAAVKAVMKKRSENAMAEWTEQPKKRKHARNTNILAHAIIFLSFFSFLNFGFQSCVNSSQISVKLNTLNHGRAQWHSLRPRRASPNHGKQFDWLYIPLRVAAQHHDWF